LAGHLIERSSRNVKFPTFQMFRLAEHLSRNFFTGRPQTHFLRSSPPHRPVQAAKLGHQR
jgi:hypothetical protein